MEAWSESTEVGCSSDCTSPTRVLALEPACVRQE